MRRSELSDCELITMKCVWDCGEKTTCQDIMDKLRDEYHLSYKDTTVYTFLKNLKEKGFISSYRRGITFFSPIRDEDEFRDDLMNKYQKFWFKGSPVSFVSNIFKINKLSAEEKAEIRKMIDELD